ncbi:MAG: FAD-dependent oxidoreductase [Pseudomonadota bacterium]
MKTSAQVVVIGGGLIGCSILYHLTKLGWRDVVLLERDELTSGSTWHAAAGIHGLHDNNNISRLQYYTMKLYNELESETGQSCGVHQPGSIYLACTQDRVHQLRIQASKASAFDAEFYEISPAEIRELHPLMNIDDVKCAMFEPLGGHVDPSGVTHAYASGARQNGAEIYRFTPVVETNPRSDGTWNVVTPKGTIHAEYVVNAAGLWGREVAALAGFELPLMTMEHQYFVTEPIPEIEAIGRELPLVADRDKEYYLRQEGKGLLVGAYEKDGRFWAEEGTPLDFGHDLLPQDLDRIVDNVMRACDRIPQLAEAGVKQVINGPMIWSPDSSALVGPVRGLRNYLCCNGIIPGFSQSAGLGITLAQWIVEGEPELDMFPWDVARFGNWASKSFTKARALDTYSSRFRIHFPNEEREAGRPMKQRPVYELQKSMGGVFGLSYGWEHPHWFAPAGVEQKDDFGFERPAWFDVMGQEVRALRESVGIVDTSNFAKYEIRGPNAVNWLDKIIANHVPKENGRTCLTPLLSLRGGLAGDFTVARISDERLFMIGSGIAEDYHCRIFESYLPADGVSFACVTDAMAGVNVAGPNARKVVETLTGKTLDNETHRFMRNRIVSINGYEAIMLRVSFTGDLGFELYVDERNQLDLYQSLLDCGEPYGIKPVGSRALGSMRIEKGYGSWSREYSPEWYPTESRMDGLVKTEKPVFHGRDGYLAIKDLPPRQLMCSFTIETEDGKNGADAWGGETIYMNGKYAGRITSGSYSFTFATSVALGYVDAELADPSNEFEVAVLGKPHKARLLSEPLFDPKGEKLRA